MARFEVVLRYGTGPDGHEYVFARTRRENGAVSERDAMVAGTVENMTDHCRGGRVVTGSHPDDPNAVVVAAMHPDGPTVFKVVTYRAVGVPGTPEPDDLEDALLASLMALGAAPL